MKKYLFLIIIASAIFSCKKDDVNNSGTKPIVPPDSSTVSNKVYDIDGNAYTPVTIGTQTWLQENLKTTHYNNGTPIINITDSAQWGRPSTGAFCNYNNDTSIGNKYGRLYNWYAINNPAGISPAGWHVASDSEWTVLINYLGGQGKAAASMKDTSMWKAPFTASNDSSNFTAMPGGSRGNTGKFIYLGTNGIFWTSTEGSETYAWYRIISSNGSGVSRFNYYKADGFSCRCVKNHP